MRSRAIRFLSGFILSFVISLILVILAPSTSHAKSAITLSERILHQRNIEEVYWNHRLWPAENPKSKPRLDEVLSYSAIQEKVEDALRTSNALEKYYRRPITAEQLQAEMQRMASQTKNPEMLRELWNSLGNDPYLIAEVLVRPILANRLLREWYSQDQRVHGLVKATAERARNINNGSANRMRSMGGEYLEMEWLKGDNENRRSLSGNQIYLTESQWNRSIAPLSHLTIGQVGGLQEDENRFYVLGVLERGIDKIKIAAVEWKKVPFEKWWEEKKNEISPVIQEPFFTYQSSAIASTACADNTWQHMPSIPVAPMGRSVWTGSELLVWGELFVLFSGGRYSPATDSWHPLNGENEPSWRNGTSAVWTGTEMIIWGGWGGSYMDNVLNTGGRYNPSTDQWITTSTSVGVPSPREAHTAVWTGQEMIIWGGRAPDNSGLNTGARYNPVSNTWNPTTLSNAPAARLSHLAEWTGNVMIVWGGVNSNIAGTYLVTGSRYNPGLDSWTAITTTGAPSARTAARSIWTGTEMIIWGGTDPTGFQFLNSGARYKPSTNSWAITTTTNAPIGRRSHSAVWTGNEMIIWGGCSNHDCSDHNSTGGRYNPVSNSWIPTSVLNAPMARTSHQAVWTGTEMIIWGGCTSGECQIKLLTGARYSPASDSWVPMNSQNSPLPRVNHSAVWTGSEMIIWGGFDRYTESTGGRYDPATDNWTDIPIDAIPGGRDAHSTVWTGTEMIVWGGRMLGFGNTTTGGRFNPTTTTWTETSWTGAPTARAFHSAVWNGTQMIVWGGCLDEGCQTLLNTGGRYNPSTNSWQTVSNVGASSARYGHTAVAAGGQMIVWGGISGANFTATNTGGRYSASTDQWLPTSLTGAPSNRYVHSAIWTGSQMIVWGGTDGSSNLNNGGRYTQSTDTWTSMSTTQAPAARRDHTAIWTGSEMVVWGGCVDIACNSFRFTGGRYNPVTDGWRSTSNASAPGRRSDHTAVWTGTHMLVWGGLHDSFAQLRTGGNYCVSSSPDFGISGSPSSIDVTQGSSGTVTTTVTSFNGFSGAVSLSCSGNPAGITCGFSVNPLTPPANTSANSTLTVSVATNVAAATYNLQVRGSNNGLTRSWNLQLTVKSNQVPALTALALNPSTVIGTNLSQGTVTLSGAASVGGVSVSLSSSNNAVATPPAAVNVPAGATSANFNITTSTVSDSNAVTIFASYGGVTKTASLTVTTDTVAIQIARYKRSTRKLTVQATSNNPSPTTLRVYKTSTNEFIGTLTSAGNGTYTGTFTWSRNPQNITVQSVLGGSATRAVTN